MHALDLEALRGSHISFCSVWTGDGPDAELRGCEAPKEPDPSYDEIKPMRTAEAQRGKGVAWTLLTQFLAEARARSYTGLSLETGAQPEFEPTRRLYASNGFSPCPPFGSYREGPHSVFMTLGLSPPPSRSATPPAPAPSPA